MKNRSYTHAEAQHVLELVHEGEQAQRRLYEAVLELHSDGVTSDRLAHLLGVSRATFYRLVLDMGATPTKA